MWRSIRTYALSNVTSLEGIISNEPVNSDAMEAAVMIAVKRRTEALG
jgi:hypothetical protein